MEKKGERRKDGERSGEPRVHRWFYLTTFLFLPVVVTPILNSPELARIASWQAHIQPCNHYTYNISCCPFEDVQCSDGSCVRKSVVCDNKPDCPDESDEHGCFSGSCKDNECDQLCREVKNGTRCDCFGGSTLKKVEGDKVACVDIDECMLGTHFCTHDCTNLNGTFECTCREGFKQLTKDEYNICKADDQNILILYNSGAWINSYNVDNQTVTPVVHAFQVNKMDIDLATDMVYWSARHRVSRSFITGAKNNTVSIGHAQAIGATSIWHSKLSIAIDWTAGNLYWITVDILNINQYQILVSKLDGRYVKTLIGDVMLASSIALDPESGRMYWSAGGPNPEIGSSWMNGMYKKTLLKLDSDRSPTGLILDHLSNGKLFWIDTKKNAIYSAYTDGTRVSRVLTTGEAQLPIALDVFENYLYWITKGSNELVRHEKHGWANTESLIQNLSHATALKVYHKRRVEIDIRKYSLYCRNQCTHLCLHVPHGYACSCPDGSRIQLLAGELLCDIEKIDQMEDPLDCKCSDKSKVCNATSPYHKCHCNVTCDPNDTAATTDDYSYDYTTDSTDEPEEVTTFEVVKAYEPERGGYGTMILVLALCIIPIVICFILSFFKRPERQLSYAQSDRSRRSVGFNAGEDSISDTFGQGSQQLLVR